MALWTMLSGYGRQPNYRFQAAQARLFDPEANYQLDVSDDPTKWPMYLNGRQIDVDVLITVYGESLGRHHDHGQSGHGDAGPPHHLDSG